MIRLSAQQVMALEDSALQRFVQRVADELPGYRGPLVGDRDRATMFAVSGEAVERGRAFGLESERALFLYTNLCVTLGCAFDSDPALPWAQTILSDDSYLGNEKIDDLWNAYMDFCEEVMEGGDQAFFPRRAFTAYLQRPGQPRFDGTAAPVAEDLMKLWPEKARRAGRDGVVAHATAAGKRAADLGLQNYFSRVRFCRISFLLGYAFDADPLHPWARSELGRIGHVPEASVMEQLEDRFCETVVVPCLDWRADDHDDRVLGGGN